MDEVNGYLSKCIQEAWPDAVVLRTDFTCEHATVERWLVRRPGQEDFSLGNTFKRAKRGCLAVVAAEKARRAKT